MRRHERRGFTALRGLKPLKIPLLNEAFTKACQAQNFNYIVLSGLQVGSICLKQYSYVVFQGVR